MPANSHEWIPNEQMLAPDPVQHSTLEVDLTQDGRAAPIVGRSPNEEKEIHLNSDDGKLQVVGSERPVLTSAKTPPPLYSDKPQPPIPSLERKILGLRRKTLFIALALAAIVLVAAIAGGVGGGIAARNRRSDKNHVVVAVRPPQYANTGLAAVQWTDQNGTLYKRVYYQGKDNTIRESAWQNSTALDTPWQVNTISSPVKPVTPIAATAGYPHASYNYSLVYILSCTGTCKLIAANRSRTSTTSPLTVSSSSVKPHPMRPSPGKTITLAVCILPPILPISPHTGIKTSKTNPRNW